MMNVRERAVCILIALALAALANQDDLTTYRERARSDDAQTLEEAFFHGNARGLIITNIKPNTLGVGGARVPCQAESYGKRVLRV